MRKILLLLLLIGSTFSVKAQLFGREWNEGYYHDTTGKKISGLLANYDMGSIFKFKESKDSKKQDISINAIKALIVKSDTIGVDSFVVATVKVFSKQTNDSVEEKRIRQVIYNTPLKLYAELTSKAAAPTVMNGMIMGDNSRIIVKYYFGKDQNTTTYLDNKNFIPVMSEILADKPALVRLIKRKKLTLYKMPEIIQFTKTGYSPINTTGY